MKKLIISMIALCNIVSLVAMESSQITKITDEDSAHFMNHFGMTVGAFKRKIEAKIYPETHGFSESVFKLSKDLNNHNNDIKIVIEKDQDLKERINLYTNVDSHITIQHALKQVRGNQGDVKKAKDFVVQSRRVLSELKLKEAYPVYSPSLIGEIDTKERENFVLRNVDFPTDEIALKDYAALFIYLTLLADKVE